MMLDTVSHVFYFLDVATSHNAEPGVLVTNPMKNFRKALETLDKHNAKDYHKQTVIAFL